MAKIDLTSLEWRELIFQGKNKEYGAYKMRGESPKRHNWSMVIITVVALVGFSIPKLIELATPKQKESMIEVTTLSQLAKAEVKQEIKKVEPVAPPPELKSSIRFTAPVIKKDEEVNDDEQIKSQEDLNKTAVTISIADVKGKNETSGKDIADIKQDITQEVEEKPYTVIEQMPVYPGGDAELLAYITKNIKYPAIAQENNIEGKVILRFVVTKTGKISNVEVLKSLDPACDKEAVRVVKTLQDWVPGKQNGVNVPVYYILPVTFKLRY